MGLHRRTAMKAGLLATVVSALGLRQGHARGASALPTLTVQGEAAVRTNIPVVRDRRASGGRCLALATGQEPGPEGWYATYTVQAPEAGGYALTAIATAPVEVPHTEATASYLRLALNGGPFREVARSQPYWYESRPAWGDLSVLDLGVLELRCGENTLTFRVSEPTVLESGTAYALALDRFTLERRAGVRVRGVSVGDGTLSTYRHGEPASLTVTLDGHPARPLRLRHTVVDHVGRRVAAGDSVVAAGETTVRTALSPLPPGNYRVTVSFDDGVTSDAEGVTAHFACLPARPAVSGAGQPLRRQRMGHLARTALPSRRLRRRDEGHGRGLGTGRPVLARHRAGTGRVRHGPPRPDDHGDAPPRALPPGGPLTGPRVGHDGRVAPPPRGPAARVPLRPPYRLTPPLGRPAVQRTRRGRHEQHR
ncbi:hypothetical protein ACF090_26660 [Streptomyces sp. NPDC014892]|uniref:hypothetical protein n=1 Tax=Streptomyces sp. NPDC014892 TaxID=3364930 RepID=UPI0036FDA83B